MIRQPGRQSERHGDRQTDGQTERQRDTETDRQTERHGHRQTGRQTERNGDRQTDTCVLCHSTGETWVAWSVLCLYQTTTPWTVVVSCTAVVSPHLVIAPVQMCTHMHTHTHPHIQTYTSVCYTEPTVLAGHLKHTNTMPFKQYTYTPLLSTVVAHTLLNTAHTVGSNWGYNPGWCRSHRTVSEMTYNVSSETLNLAQSNPWW